jgi:hypothetical protein
MRHSVAVPGEKIMNMVWNRHVSNGIRELGYDFATRTMTAVFASGITKCHNPVAYPLHASISHASFAERLNKEIVEGKILMADMA